MSKITNDGLTRSGTGCLIAVPIWQQRASYRYRSFLKQSSLFTNWCKHPAYSIKHTDNTEHHYTKNKTEP